MGHWELLLLAVGLAMDAFTVSVCGSLALTPTSRTKGALKFGLWFGFFQFLMPVIGYFCAVEMSFIIEVYAHWIAFVLLLYLGVSMIRNADEADVCNIKQYYTFKEMLALAIATSIDALVIGVSVAFLAVDIWKFSLLIGVVTFAFSMVGGVLGFRLGERVGSRATLVGGAVLVFIGVKILFENLGFL